MDTLNAFIKPLWNEIKDTAVNLRHELHAWPELGYQEIETTRRICQFLTGHGVAHRTFDNLTGLVAFIDAGKPVTVGLRVDIDALPLEENTGAPFSSKNKGVMHACGHDMHASTGAAMAVLLHRMRERLPVNVKVLFQPAEECNPHGGAKAMEELGVLRNPDVSFMLGFHVWPGYPLGEIGIRPGPMMASSNKFRITVNGVAAHAAQPHKGVDAILIASEILHAVYTVLPRTVDSFTSYVLSIGEILSRGRYNIISDHVEMVGTVRTLDGETRDYIRGWLAGTVERLPAVYGGKGSLVFDQGYDVVVNDAALTGLFTRHAEALLGEAAVHTLTPPSLVAEDFSVFSNAVPSIYFHLGCGCSHSLHSEQFLAKEETLNIGVELLSSFLLSEDFVGFINNR